MVAGKRMGEPTKPRQSAKTKKNTNGTKPPKEAEAQAEPAQEVAPPTQPEGESPPAEGDNSKNRTVGELSEEERRNLLFQLKNALKNDKAELASVTGRMRNTKKRIKSYGFTISLVEKLILAEEDDGRLKLLAEISESKEALESYSYAVQVELFPDAEMRVPLVDKAAKEGEIAFHEGGACTGGRYAPGSEGWNAWIKRYQDLVAMQVRTGIQSFEAGGATPIEGAIAEKDELDEAMEEVTAGAPLPREEWKDGLRETIAEGDALIRDVSSQLGGANDTPTTLS